MVLNEEQSREGEGMDVDCCSVSTSHPTAMSSSSSSSAAPLALPPVRTLFATRRILGGEGRGGGPGAALAAVYAVVVFILIGAVRVLLGVWLAIGAVLFAQPAARSLRNVRAGVAAPVCALAGLLGMRATLENPADLERILAADTQPGSAGRVVFVANQVRSMAAWR
jgi:hypothetical protein